MKYIPSKSVTSCMIASETNIAIFSYTIVLLRL